MTENKDYRADASDRSCPSLSRGESGDTTPAAANRLHSISLPAQSFVDAAIDAELYRLVA